jgi:IclR family transcriptional regulator, pca regulon regulatory protein
MPDFVNSLSRGLMILKAFSRTRPMLRLQELTTITDLPKTTVLRLLRTLITLNFVQYSASSKQYFLGPETLSLGFTVLTNMELRKTALPYIEALSSQSNQNTAIGILVGTDMVCIERIKKIRLLTIDLYVGARLNLYRSAMGMAFLAFLGREEYKRILAKILSEKGEDDFIGQNGENLAGILETVRQKGYALSDNELIPGVIGIGAPIFNYNGEVEAAISMPVVRGVVGKEELIERYVPMLIDTAKKISLARGHGAK